MKCIYALLLMLTAVAAHGQTVDFTIDVAQGARPISPYIYGINWVHAGEPLHADWNLASRRLGGNRLSNYNWEINASNSGNDCDDACRNQNDDWLTYRLPSEDQAEPALLPRTFHTDSRAMGCYSLVQLQAAGYVAADRNENVRPVPPAPSGRWKEVRPAKGSPFSVSPDTEDGFVYMDEQVNELVTQFGNSANGGVQGYAVDNEPGLWYTSHPRLRGLSYMNAAEVEAAEQQGVQAVKDAKAKCTEVIDKSIALARAVKAVDAGAEIFGPAWWGFLDYYSLHQAPDWSTYSGTYTTYLNMYLDRMKAAEADAGGRLLDVLDLHWYPQMSETPENIMAATRSLWDLTYKEDSWIARDVLNGPIKLFPTLKASIDTYYPGTKLAITEFRFGDENNGDTYYSGIAIADALGIFGRDGVYMAHYHPVDLDAPIEGYVAAAYKIYRNYDGQNSTYGNTAVQALTSDVAGTSIYAAYDQSQPRYLHMIAVNKTNSPVQGRFAVGDGAGGPFTRGRVYAFDAAGAAITERDPVPAIVDNRFTYTLAPRSVMHFVLDRSTSAVHADGIAGEGGARLLEATPNPFTTHATVRFLLPRAGTARLVLYDALGRPVATPAEGSYDAGEHSITITGGHLPAGRYFCRLYAGGTVQAMPVTVVR